MRNKLLNSVLKVNVSVKTISKFNFFILIIFSCKFISCSYPNNINGKYRCCKGNYWTSKNIEIRQDSTYSYLEITCMRKDSSSGTWRIKNGKYLILNSRDIKPKDSLSYLILLKAERVNSDSITIKIIDQDKEPYPFIGCALYKDQKFIIGRETEFEGICKIQKVEFDKIHFLHTDKFYDVVDKDFNYYFFKLKHDPFTNYYVPFKNKEFNIKRKRLIDLSDRKSFIKQ
jgi:hypothetical protein